MERFGVRRIEQKVLWQCELMGQLSDGLWENDDIPARLWSMDSVVVDNENDLGTAVRVPLKVDFTDELLVEVCGDRMIDYVKLVLAFPQLEALLADHHAWHYAFCSQNDADCIKFFGVPFEQVAEKAKAVEYSMETLLEDLSEINQFARLK